jgi:hypothetical protein
VEVYEFQERREEMTEKFTQGEWRVTRYKDDPEFGLYNYLIVETAEDEPQKIAAMFQREDINSEANAALIAAAPEMYRVLKFVKGALGHGSLVMEIDKVLQKARGEE